MTSRLPLAVLRAQSDARLVELTSAGSERAFEAIVQRYRALLLRHCRCVLRDKEAEDVVQSALLSAWSAMRDGAAVRELRPWLVSIARNRALDALRKSGYDYDELRESISALSGPEEEIERRAVVRRTLAGLAALPPSQREALLRVAVEGQSQAQAADDLGLTEGAVRQLVYRARAGLRTLAGAVVPFPLVSWAAALGGSAPGVERAAEIAAASAPAAAPVAVKAGALLATAALVTAAPTAVNHVSGSRDEPVRANVPSLATPAPATSQRGSAVTLAQAAAGEDSHSEAARRDDDADRGENGDHGRSSDSGKPDEPRSEGDGAADNDRSEQDGEDGSRERADDDLAGEPHSPRSSGEDDEDDAESDDDPARVVAATEDDERRDDADDAPDTSDERLSSAPSSEADSVDD